MVRARKCSSPVNQASASAPIEPVGQYAVKLVFDDGHDTGLFTWKYLYELGRDHARNWERYQARVAASTAGGGRGGA